MSVIEVGGISIDLSKVPKVPKVLEVPPWKVTSGGIIIPANTNATTNNIPIDTPAIGTKVSSLLEKTPRVVEQREKGAVDGNTDVAETEKKKITINGRNIDLTDLEIGSSKRNNFFKSLKSYVKNNSFDDIFNFLKPLDGKRIVQPQERFMNWDNMMSKYDKNIPSISQLVSIYILKQVLGVLLGDENKLLGNLESNWYWSSTKYNPDNKAAYVLNMKDGNKLYHDKKCIRHVICIYD